MTAVDIQSAARSPTTQNDRLEHAHEKHVHLSSLSHEVSHSDVSIR